MSKYLVISADGHAGPPASVYREYLDPGLRDRFDEHQRTMAELREAMQHASNSDFRAQWEEETDGDGGLRAAFDSSARNALLDEEGVAAEVLFPDTDVLGTGRVAASPFGTGLAGAAGDPREVVEGSRAHNRWLADFVSEEPGTEDRRRSDPGDHPGHGYRAETGPRGQGLGSPRHPDPDSAGSIVPPITTCGTTRSGHSPRSSSSSFIRTRARDPLISVSALGCFPSTPARPVGGRARPLATLIWGGVFERHPALMYSMAENGAWWVPDQIRKMDEKWLGGQTRGS